MMPAENKAVLPFLSILVFCKKFKFLKDKPYTSMFIPRHDNIEVLSCYQQDVKSKLFASYVLRSANSAYIRWKYNKLRNSFTTFLLLCAVGCGWRDK
jgi:hypothetical protein